MDFEILAFKIFEIVMACMLIPSIIAFIFGIKQYPQNKKDINELEKNTEMNTYEKAYKLRHLNMQLVTTLCCVTIIVFSLACFLDLIGLINIS